MTELHLGSVRSRVFTCRDVAETASDYIEGELSPWALLRVRLHLAMCRDCRRYLAQLRETVRLLRWRAPPETSGEERLIEAVRAQAGSGGTPHPNGAGRGAT